MNMIETSKEIVNVQTNKTLTVGEACVAFADMIENIQDILTECSKIDNANPTISDNLEIALHKIAGLISKYKIGQHLYAKNLLG